MPWQEAARLDWRLLWRSMSQSSGELWSVIGLALIAAVTAGESSFDLGAQLAANQIEPPRARLLVDLRLWATFLAAFVFILTTGQLSFMRRLLADLSMRPVSRRQAFLALQAISFGGRQSLALISVGLPLLILFGTWLDGAALISATVATILLLRLPVAILTIGARAASASMPIALATALAIATTVGALWLRAPELLLASLPPFLVTRILMDDAATSAWAGLAMWTLTLATIDYCTMGLQGAPVPSTGAARPHRPLSAAVRHLAAVTGCLPVVLHGELLRLSRWRRHQLSWLMCAMLMVLLGSRLPSPSPGLLPVVILLLIPVHVGGSTLANLFAVDSAGFVAMVMSPISLGAVMRAKVIATMVFTVVAELAGVLFLVAHGTAAWAAIAAGIALAAGLFTWTAATGLLTSVLFPSASDPQTVGGSMVSTPAAIVIVAGGALYLGLALRLVFLFESGRVTLEASALAGAGLIALVVAAFVTASRLAPRVAARRVEAMIASLTANPGTGA